MNLPFFGEDVVDLHLVVTQQFARVGVKNLQRHFNQMVRCQTRSFVKIERNIQDQHRATVPRGSTASLDLV